MLRNPAVVVVDPAAATATVSLTAAIVPTVVGPGAAPGVGVVPGAASLFPIPLGPSTRLLLGPLAASTA